MSACQTDGLWSHWQQWTDCSVTCGGGVRFRIRTCNNPKPSKGGLDCHGQRMETDICDTKPCFERRLKRLILVTSFARMKFLKNLTKCHLLAWFCFRRMYWRKGVHQCNFMPNPQVLLHDMLKPKFRR